MVRSLISPFIKEDKLICCQDLCGVMIALHFCILFLIFENVGFVCEMIRVGFTHDILNSSYASE